MQTGTESARRTCVIYITAQLPFGATEPFIVPEIAELERQGCDVTVIPVRPKGAVVHGDALALLPNTVAAPLLSGAILGAALAEALRAPAAVGRALFSLRRSRNLRIFLKNLAVFPKALWLARRARRLGADHLHAHWASTSSTLAMVASQVSAIPWSFTAHRWDIAEDNLLSLKARRSAFVRVISAHGGEELRGIVARPSWSPWLLHLGVQLPSRRQGKQAVEPPLRILTAARFVEKKGHVYLIDAVRLLKERGLYVRAELAGDGPLAAALRKRVSDLGLEREVVFLGTLAHEELLSAMCDGAWHVAALPSIVTDSGDLEGIPVSLIEAMACGLPAVGTDCGGIPELLGDGAGLMVAAADADALAQALATLAEDGALRAALADRGRKRVEEAFSVDRVAAALHARFRDSPGPASTSPP